MDTKTTDSSPNTTKLHHLVIRLPKDQAAFFYFQLEANEGLCFYSTLDQSLNSTFRDIEIFHPENLTREFDHLIDSLKNELSMEIVCDEWCDDHRDVIETFKKDGKKHI